MEDEEAFADLGRTILTRLGYRVITASKPSEAIQLAKESPERIELIITDIIMPEMNGKELSSILLKENPDIKILFMSGYPSNVIAYQGILEEGINFIQKPFSLKEISLKIRRVLDAE